MEKKQNTIKEENSRPINQNNFDVQKWDEEEGNIGDLAVNPLLSVPTYEEIEIKKPNNNNSLPSSKAPEQWRTTSVIKFYKPKLPDNKPPRLNLKPFHIFGYRERDAHNNIKYIDNNSILYPAGKVAIIQNLTNYEQKLFVRHRREICSLCVNNNKNLIATGEDYYCDENDNNTTLRIWDSKTLDEIAAIVLPFNGIKAISFSLDDKYLICCCLDENHKVALIDVNNKKLLFDMDGSEKKILSIAFKSDKEFATVGINHYKFWTIIDNKLISKEYTNTLDNFDSKLGIISVIGENFLTGSSLGYITLWKDNVNLKMKRCHNSQIDSLYSDNKIIISGGRDKTLQILDPDLTILKKIGLDLFFNSNELINCSPKSIDILSEEQGQKGIKKILLGISSGDILELFFNKNILEEEKPSIKVYNSSHYSTHYSEINEITSITYWKKLNMFITTSEDKTIRFWNLETKRQSNFIKINEDIKPTCSTISRSENYLAIGFNSGNIKFYSTLDFQIGKDLKERTDPITAIKFSKDDDLIACATKDERGNNVIDIYFTSSYNKFGTLKGAQNTINGLDWSEDGKYIVCFSHEKECRVFSVIDKFMISQYSDIDFKEWNTWTNGYGWPLRGYYDSKEGNVPIYACERFKLNEDDDNYIIAVGDYNGHIKLYKYPIVNKDQKYIDNIIEHGKKVTNVKFGKVGNKYILFTSGADGCLIAWEIQKI